MNETPHTRKTTPENSFDFRELRGAVGDLGTTLPLAFLLIMHNDFPAARLFFLWGMAYIAVGWFYKVPVSIQPLKAMTVIAVTTGLSVSFLSSAAVLYGILFLILSTTGLIQWLHQWFSRAIVRGIQLGIGLLLMHKAWQLIADHALYLDGSGEIGFWIFPVSAGFLVLLYGSIKWLGRSIALELIILGMGLSLLAGVTINSGTPGGPAWQWNTPDWSPWWNMITLLIIPQLPLTLGNAVYAANDACRAFWPEQSKRVTAPRLAGSIGLLNVLIGMLGGFPICHGAGGIAAHHRFSGKTGGTVMILGLCFVILALTQSFSTLLFLIPVPVLGILLLFDSWQMMTLLKKLDKMNQLAVAVWVGAISFLTHNLTIALITGIALEFALNYWSVELPFPRLLKNSDMVNRK